MDSGFLSSDSSIPQIWVAYCLRRPDWHSGKWDLLLISIQQIILWTMWSLTISGPFPINAFFYNKLHCEWCLWKIVSQNFMKGFKRQAKGFWLHLEGKCITYLCCKEHHTQQLRTHLNENKTIRWSESERFMEYRSVKNILLWEELYQKHQHHPFHTLLAVLYVNSSNTVYFFPQGHAEMFYDLTLFCSWFIWRKGN